MKQFLLDLTWVIDWFGPKS